MPGYPHRTGETFTRTMLTGASGARTMLLGAGGARPIPAAYSGQGSVVAVDQELGEVRQFPIGFELAAINTTIQAQITVQPQVIYRSERFAVAASLATFFDLNDLKIGKDSQFAAANPVPCEVLDNRSVGVRMSLDTAQPGVTITAVFTNIDTVTHAFKAAMFGTVLQH